MNRTLNCVLAFTITSAILLQLSFDAVAELPAAEKAPANTGEINVYVSPALAIDSSVEFNAVLTGQNVNDSKTILLSSNSQSVNENQDARNNSSAEFVGLEDGEYTLKITAPGFADYSQNIKVDGQAYAVKLMTGFAKGISYEENSPHPGVLVIGDVNDDGSVNENDKNSLIDIIDNGKTSEEGFPLADLNGDGEINLVDLDYLAKGYNIDKDTAAVPEKSIPSSVISADVGKGTVFEGKLEDLFTGGEGVVLSAENGQPISQDNPLSFSVDIAQNGNASNADGIIISAAEANPISKGLLDIVYEADGQEYTAKAVIEYGVHHLLDDESVTVTQDDEGNIEIDLGEQIAVKKVTISIYGMLNNNNLAEISQVEFLNGMENRIPEPEMDIPENLTAKAGSKQFSLSWDSCANVTGYEVMIKQGVDYEVVKVNGNSLSVTSFKGEKLVNNTQYTVSVQSVNGTWSSGYCNPITVTPKPDKRPDNPDNVSAVGKYKSIVISWKKTEDAESYNIYYKKTSEESYHKIEGVPVNSYTIDGLEDKTEYTAYVTAVNEIGESGPSLSANAVTTDLQPAVVPQYFLINTIQNKQPSEHIISAWQNSNSMVDSPLDTDSTTAWGTVDGDPASYYYRNTWDDGGYNYLNNHGLFYEFDEEYTIQNIALQEITPLDLSYSYVKVNCWDKNGNLTSYGNNQASIARKQDKDGHTYYLIKLPQKTQIKKIQIGLARYLAYGNINVSEVYFYRYDSILDDVFALFEDDLHTTLKADVTQADIDALKTRLNTPDSVSGELNPDYDIILREIENAQDILNNGDLRPAKEIHTDISTYDVNRGFGGLNAWQPLGITADGGSSVTVYVGHSSKKSGENTNLQLVATQYHSESSPMFRTIASLKTGVNVIDIPKLWTTDAECGGALYIQYTGNNPNERYAVRVSGGNSVPILDLYKVTDDQEKAARIEKYVAEITEYADILEKLHNQLHKNSENSNVNKYEFNERNCVLGATDILLDTMMLSLPAKRVAIGLGTGTASEKAKRIADSLNNMENMMYLFYQHKGLNANAENEVDRIPKQHLNIRYQRMFGGAFMYASGNHIGIEWNECAGMINCAPFTADENGKYASGHLFGWGIAHEIGHCINQGSYAVAEITNNYFAQLTRSKDSNDTVRFTYGNIYKKVTSNTTGAASNVFTQLGMYWQLHLAYDYGYNYKTYEDYNDQLSNLFFARVDTYSRTPAKAPAPNGIQLTLSGGTDQNLMRLACAAAEKNILDFFKRWGKVPDADTIAYAEQFETETRAIYYTDDNSRVYRIENHGGVGVGTKGDYEAVGDETAAKLASPNSNQVNFTFSSKNISNDDILGYEIVRCTTEGGVVSKEAVGFTTESTYTDSVPTMNNRVVYYEITLIDKYLNRSAVKVLDPVKIRTDGDIDKSQWTVSYNGLKAENPPASQIGDEDSPCNPVPEDPILDICDNNYNTVYTAILSQNAEIELSFNKYLTISGFRYKMGDTDPIQEYKVMIKDNSGSWTEISSGELNGDKTIYFKNSDGKYVSTYKTDSVKLVIPNQNGKRISIAEIDILGVTGDNVDFRYTDDGTSAAGILSESFKYGESSEDVIPQGSIVFVGTYKGSPAYNVVLLYDQNGNIVGGFDNEGNLKAQQIILADIPDGTGPIQDVSDGTWIYWIEPEDNVDLSGISQVRAELYRVNNALTNEGQRMVSDSLFVSVPAQLPEITLNSNH